MEFHNKAKLFTPVLFDRVDQAHRQQKKSGEKMMCVCKCMLEICAKTYEWRRRKIFKRNINEQIELMARENKNQINDGNAQ